MSDKEVIIRALEIAKSWDDGESFKQTIADLEYMIEVGVWEEVTVSYNELPNLLRLLAEQMETCGEPSDEPIDWDGLRNQLIELKKE